MLLCPNHHDEATKGAMLEDHQRQYKLAPYNKKNYTKGMLTINHGVPIVKMGNCNFVGNGDYISVNKQSLLSLKSEKGRLLISLKLYGESDRIILKIVNNEWTSGDSVPWDITANYQYLKIRHRKRDIGLEIDTKAIPIFMRVKLLYKKQLSDFSPNRVLFNGVVKQIRIINMSFIGSKLHVSTDKSALSVLPSLQNRDGKILAGTNIDMCLKQCHQVEN